MKNTLLLVITVIAFSISSQAQSISKNAIGLRLGDNDGFGTEVSYQRALGESNRLELDLGWRSNNDYNAFRLTGLYQWVWVLDGNFNWYAGPGAGLAHINFDDSINTIYGDSETYLYIAGNLGIEYNFDIPLLLSLDIRPEYSFGEYIDDLDLDIALGIRYQF